MRFIWIFGLASGLTHVCAPPACAQVPDEGHHAGVVFLQGGVTVTSLLNDTQDTQAGYLHYNFIGTLDWPTIGAAFGGGVFVARRWSVGVEIGLRRELSSVISEQEYEHTSQGQRTSLYSSRERLLSTLVRFHVAHARRIDVQPLGGVTRSWSSQSLTGRSGSYVFAGRAPVPISAPDVAVGANKWGVAGGADVGLALGRGVTIVCSPRWHWIHRDEYDSYSHVVPNASRVIMSGSLGIRWTAITRRNRR